MATLNRYLKKQCIEKSNFEYDKDNLPADPALHKPIMGYHPNVRDEIWRCTTVDKAFCLYCYLFKSDSKQHAGSGNAFIVKGFQNWKQKEKLGEHVGGPNSTHNRAWRNCQALMNEQQHIRTFVNRQTNQAQNDYWMHLNASIDCVRFLLRQGLAFHSHDE
ncbi:hypothetical protein GH714_007615 [Hevea brasiliensis]|uniref:TTF-type domain-containing protein n=1 Tax=Hevea brasiliensis TaxID=3981 RepID=A0A6A6N1B0_HEVBR|nr:hypothetical protein GH714_007615 [Hevea brasiliensis]